MADSGTTTTAASGVELIAAERRRQVEAEGWTPGHDAEHTNGELADAAALYIAAVQYGQHGDHLFNWKTPAHGWIKNGCSNERMLIKAGALIAAEIDRLRHQDGTHAACGVWFKVKAHADAYCTLPALHGGDHVG